MTKLSQNPNSKKVHNVRAFEVVNNVFIYTLERGCDILYRVHIQLSDGSYNVVIDNLKDYATLSSEQSFCMRLVRAYFSVD